MRIHEVMSTEVVTGTPTDRVREVVVKMLSRHCGANPIVGANHELLGIVTLRDVMLPMYPNYGDYIHDAVHSRDFLEMEQNYPEVLQGLEASFQLVKQFPGTLGDGTVFVYLSKP